MLPEIPIRSSQQLGHLIATARRKKKLSQRDVARELGVTQAWVSRVERGQQKSWIGQVLRLAAWLEINISGNLAHEQTSKKSSRHANFPDSNDALKQK